MTGRPRQRLTWAGLALGALAVGCASGTSESALGQLKVRPAFAAGEEPAAFGVVVERVRVVVRRGGAVIIDTTMAFEDGATLSWILDLASPPELLEVSADLDGGGRQLYRGSQETSVGTGVGSGVAVTDVPVSYIGPAVATVEVTPPEVTSSLAGGSQQFQALARGLGGAPQSGFVFAWSSSDPTVATVDPVTGLATPLGPGTTVITATAGGIVGTARLTLLPIATIIVLPGTETFSAFGAQRQFVAQALDASGAAVPGVAFAWSSDTPGVATIDPVTGLAIAVGNGVTGISASAAGITGSSALTVRQVVATVTVSPGNAALGALGAALAFTAQARDAGGFVVEDAVFAWSSSDPAVATVGASSGVASAVAVGSASVVATAGGVSGSAPLTVSQVVASIVVTPAFASLGAGNATQQYSAVAFDANGHVIPGVQFAWTSSAPFVAAINPSSGLATAVSIGATTIGATAGGVTATASLTVTQAGRGLTIVPGQAILTDLGVTQQFTAVVTDENGAAMPGVQFAWSSGSPSVATIGTASGLATSAGFGVSTITATGAGLSGTALLAVIQTIASVEVTPASGSIATGGTLAFTAVARDAGGRIMPGGGFLWSSSAPGVATVAGNGLATGVGPGTATISASAGGATGRATLSVTAGGTGPVASITVTPNPGVIDALGDSRLFHAVARDANGNVMPGIAFTWSSSQPGIAEVDHAGLATGVATGTATITAAAGGATGGAVVQVRQIVVSIAVQPALATLGIGDSLPLVAVARDARGNAIPGVSFVWTSSDPAVATPDATGMVRTTAAGSATIAAAANGVTGTANLNVVTVGSIRILPREPEVFVGATIQLTAQVFDPAGNLLPGVRVTWSSAHPLIASIGGASGLATGLLGGTATLSATAGGVTGRIILRVRD